MRGAKVCVVVGGGPGLGASAARRFAKEGFDVALVARRRDVLEAVAAEISPASTFSAPAHSAPMHATAPAL